MYKGAVRSVITICGETGKFTVIISLYQRSSFSPLPLYTDYGCVSYSYSVGGTLVYAVCG